MEENTRTDRKRETDITGHRHRGRWEKIVTRSKEKKKKVEDRSTRPVRRREDKSKQYRTEKERDTQSDTEREIKTTKLEQREERKGHIVKE